jgi:hypothetical protein
VDGFTPDFFIYLGAVAFIDEGIEKHFWRFYASCRSIGCSSSLSAEDDRKAVSFKRSKNTVALATPFLQVFLLIC